MKRIVQLGGMLIALGMLFASCQMGTSDASFSGNSAEQESSNINGITISVGSIDNNSRTILPADWDKDTAEKLSYVLLAKKTDGPGGYETKKTFSYAELKGGTAVVNLDLTVWDLKLIGYITEGTGEEGYKTHPCLEKELLGEDFSKGKKTAVFDLKPVDPTKTTTSATGNVDVTIAWLTTQPMRLEFGIYETGKNTDDIVDDEGRGDAFSGFKEIKPKADFVSDGTAYKYSWKQNNVPAGMYKFAAVFYNAETGGEVIGYYIDWLYVDGGNDSIATVNYGDKFNTLPDNPTWLAVETVFVPQKLTTANNDVNDWYYAKFHWNDISTNETGFELVITEDDGTEHVVSSEKDGDGLKSDKWYNGPGIEDTTFNSTTTPNNLDAGRTWVVLKLKTGKLYTAKIRAINKYTPAYTDTDKTSAKFCDNLNRNGDGKGRSYAPIVADNTGTKKQFGMFTVNYALSDGNVTETKGAAKTDTEVKNYVVGFNYSNEQQDLMTDDTLSYPHVSKTGSVFDHWEDSANSKVNVISKTKKENFGLTAVWSGTDVYVSVTFPSYANAQDVKIVQDKNKDNTFTFKYNKDETNNDPKKNLIEINAGANLLSPITFELSEVGDNGKIIATGTGTTTSEVYGTITPTSTGWSWAPTEKTTPGLYCLQITGKYKAGFDSKEDDDLELTLCGNIYIKVMN